MCDSLNVSVIVSASAALKDPYCLLSIPENRRRNLKIIVPKETIDRLTHIAYNSVDRKKGISAEYAKAFLGWFNEAMGSSKFGFSEVSFSLGGIFSLAQAINEKVGNEKAQILTTFDEEKILAKHYGIELFTDIVYDPNAVARHVYSKFPKTLTIDVPKEIIDNAFLSEPKILPPDFGVENYFPNQNYVLRCGNVHALLTYNSFVNKLEKVTLPNSDCKKGDKMVSVFGPKNFDQCFFSHHIKSPARRLTVGFGVSGGGKSVGAVVGAFSQILTNGNSETTKTGPLFDEMFGFKRIIFFKGSDPDSETYPGILPGNARQKVDHETGSLRDLLDILAGHDEIEILKSRKNDPDLLGSLEAEKILSFESLAGITGRSFVRSMVLIDEAQLYSEKIIQVLLNRMGRGTKVIITGDLLQMGVDGYLHNNGLSFVAEKLAYNPYVAFVSFEQSVRSITSQMCAEAFAKMF